MSTAIDETIKEIAVKNGISISKDDPVLVLQTINDLLIEKNKKNQEALFKELKEEIESISSDWKSNAKEKAENLLRAAIRSSKQSMDEILQQAAKEHCSAIRDECDNFLLEMKSLNDEAKRNYRLTIIGCGFMFSSSVILSLTMFFLR